MKIVIELDEILYGEFLTYGIVGLNVDNQIEISKAIRKGTPLPEHHGRLIDADRVIAEMNDMKVGGEVFTTAVNYVKLTMKDAPTIIEADKE